MGSRTLVSFGGAANEPDLVCRQRHGKLLIWARNESVELDQFMNIHALTPAHGGWLLVRAARPPARLVTQIHGRVIWGGGSWETS